LFDLTLNIITYPVNLFTLFINSSYIFYTNTSTNIYTSIFIYVTDNKNLHSYLSYFLLFILNLHLTFDFYIFEPFINFLTYTFFTSILAFSSNIANYMYVHCFNFTLYSSIITSLKFIVLIALLVFVRGGIPRYRFDYLTKLGWTKFLSLILLSFLLELYLIWIF
jgi:hypothetical protein